MSQGKSSRSSREVVELQLLFEISRILDRSIHLDDVLPPVLKTMGERMGMVRGTLSLLDRGTNEISIEAAYGLSSSQKERGRYKVGEGVTGKVVQSGRPAVVPRISDEPMFLNKTKARKRLRKKDISFICVPIKLGNETIGAFSVDRLFDEGVSFQEDVRLLSTITSMIAQAVKLRQEVQEERRQLLDENTRLQEELRDRFQPANIIGSSGAIQEVYDMIGQVSKSEATVLIQGESGTGKELVANAIHYNSLRATKPFVKVNCAALPDTIIESELFGHEKGAFTGAVKERPGRFELASGGTIFLDEVGELSAATQVKLLRVLQEREFERVGGTETISCDVRVIAATNRDVEKLVARNALREDLYYRLNVFPIHVPPLRHRKTDIPLLVDYFVEKHSRANRKTILRVSTSAIDMLMSYHWPGNIRELENCIERAVLMSNDDVIHGYHLSPTLQTAEASGTSNTGTLQEALDNLERELILDALKNSNGNKAEAARKLGISERVIGLRVEKHDIKPKRFRPTE